MNDDTHIISMTVAAFKTSQHMASYQTERDIVDWLRERAQIVGAGGPTMAALMEIPLGLADAIEAGEYRDA